MSPTPLSTHEGRHGARAALELIGADRRTDERSPDARWRPVHESVEELPELAVAAQMYAIHRRIAAETGLTGLEDTRARVQDAAEAVVRRLGAAHAALVPGSRRWTDLVAHHADELETLWAYEPDEAMLGLPGVVARELSDALRHRTATTGGPGAALARAAGAALALRLLAEDTRLPFLDGA
ncbi:hypothetical protein [Patulibacter minatonensis]|uniref:hypothetical protein n=1 Tax=Patulibacter minatonensis TaxID=298163 RepID=UPI0012F7D2F3|nr:hypothetical protein [Patulibacter minatonensis]